MEVLNISNVNALGEVVLNDQRLLELIQIYPFLYNPRIKPYQDSDYDNWAWQRITSAFNRSYEDATIPLVQFSESELQQRWHILQPIIKSLSKVCDISQIPEALRQSVIKISVQLYNQPTETPAKKYTTAQSLIMENIEMVERLPLIERKRLEAEMMELILASELEAKGTIKLGVVEIQRVETEYENFLKTIRLKELFVLCDNTMDKMNSNPENGNGKLPTNDCYITTPDNPDVDYNTEQLDENMETNKVTNSNGSNESKTMKDNVPLYDGLLEPMEPKKWIPLDQAYMHVRPCVVRIQRFSMEDYIPLSKIKKDLD